MEQQEKILIASPELISKIGEIYDKLTRVISYIEGTREDTDEFISGEDARKMLHVSRCTWQTMRDQHRIPFSQIGRKIYVRKSDVLAYLDNHVIKK